MQTDDTHTLLTPHTKDGIAMLVLTRKLKESIVIDGNITVSVTAIDGNKVRIGISAPPEIIIEREELRARRLQFESELPQGSVIETGA
jgi:carbon storage regulator